VSTKKNQTRNLTLAVNVTGPIPSLSTPGVKTFHLFTTEIAGVDEVIMAGDSFSVNTLSVNKGDKVTVNFYNVDPVQEGRHSFTIGDPYKVDIDVAFAENGSVTFTAINEGLFPYYCKYHLPVMVGHVASMRSRYIILFFTTTLNLLDRRLQAFLQIKNMINNKRRNQRK
jgi:plastocyanin